MFFVNDYLSLINIFNQCNRLFNHKKILIGIGEVDLYAKYHSNK